MPAAKQLTSWSISRFNTYDQCPLKAKLDYIDKVPEAGPKSEALVRGNDIHVLAEQYLKGALPRLPKELRLAGNEFRRLRALRERHPLRVIVEETSARRSDWTATTWNDWNGCWVRIKLDVAHLEDGPDGPVGIVTDWKTGRHRPDDLAEYERQLDLYALDALLRWETLIPHGLVVRPRLVYLDTPVVVEPRIYTGADLPGLKKAWSKRVQPMLKDKRFAPKANRWCRFCRHGVSQGGQCKLG